MKSIFLTAILFFALNSQFAYTQQYRFLQTELYGWQLYGGYLTNSYSADFTNFSGTISCDKFTKGNGSGSAFGLQFELPASNTVSIVGGIGMHDRSGSLSSTSVFPIRYDNSPNGFTGVVMDQTIATSMSFLETQIDARYVILEKYSFAFRLIGGLRIGFPVQGQYDQKSTIISPENVGFYVNGNTLQSRELASGSINSFAGIQSGGVIGIEPMLRVSPSMHLTSSIMYDIPFSSALSDASLRISGIRALFGIRYSMRVFAPSPNTP